MLEGGRHRPRRRCRPPRQSQPLEDPFDGLQRRVQGCHALAEPLHPVLVGRRGAPVVVRFRGGPVVVVGYEDGAPWVRMRAPRGRALAGRRPVQAGCRRSLRMFSRSAAACRGRVVQGGGLAHRRLGRGGVLARDAAQRVGHQRRPGRVRPPGGAAARAKSSGAPAAQVYGKNTSLISRPRTTGPYPNLSSFMSDLRSASSRLSLLRQPSVHLGNLLRQPRVEVRQSRHAPRRLRHAFRPSRS